MGHSDISLSNIILFRAVFPMLSFNIIHNFFHCRVCSQITFTTTATITTKTRGGKKMEEISYWIIKDTINHIDYRIDN